MIEFIMRYWIEFGFGLILSSVGLLFKKVQKWSNEQKALKDGVVALLHDRLYQGGKYYINSKEISLNDIKNMEYLYDSYHELGGNGTGTEIFERIKDLPLKEDDLK